MEVCGAGGRSRGDLSAGVSLTWTPGRVGLGGLGEDLGDLGESGLDPLWELVCEPGGVSGHSPLSCAVGAWRAQAAPFLLSMAGTGVKTAGNSPTAAPSVQDWPKGLCT